MRLGTTTALACGIVTLVLVESRTVRAQIFVGTWVRQDLPMTMTVEVCCGKGRRLTYKVADTVMVIETLLDGKDAQVLVNGKPSGETMAITQIDDRHANAVVSMNGKPFGTAKGTLSADGKTLTVEDDFTSAAGGQQVGKQTETWIRK